jgi:thiol-disulfide isomerase/thioredoxin
MMEAGPDANRPPHILFVVMFSSRDEAAMTKKILICLALAAALVSGVLYGKGLLNVHHGLTPPASLATLTLEKSPKPAPAVAFADAAGGSHALGDLKGHYVLLNLWATWCAPCVSELPALARLKMAVPGLKVMAVNVDSQKVDAAAFLKAHNASSLGTYADNDKVMMKNFLAQGLPLTVLIDPTGKVVARAEGPAEWGSPEAVDYFKGLAGS